jgi:hypothetical protein
MGIEAMKVAIRTKCYGVTVFTRILCLTQGFYLEISLTSVIAKLRAQHQVSCTRHDGEAQDF